MKIDILLCPEDRERYQAPEVLVLDVDRVQDTPAKMLIRWESETNYPVERAINEIGPGCPAAAVLVCVWLARKQAGLDGGGIDDDGAPERYSALADLRTMRVRLRPHREPEPLGGDVDPPAPSPDHSSPG